MAKEEAPAEEPKAAGGKKKLVIIIGAVVVVALIALGAVFALKGKPAEEGEEGAEAGGEEEEGHGAEGEEGAEGEAAPAVLPLETFIVNLQVKGSFLKTTINLEFTEPELPHTVENEVPKIRDTIIRVLSSKGSAEILTADGKERLREELRDAINQTLGAEDVSKVYFTEFIIQ